MRAHAELLKKVAKPIYLGSKVGSSFRDQRRVSDSESGEQFGFGGTGKG